jgi:hypothetical protein
MFRTGGDNTSTTGGVTVTVEPGVGLPGDVDYGTIPSDLIRDEIAETQLFRDFISKFGDKLEGKGQAAADWLEALVKYGSGDATLKDMQEVDVSGLMDVEGFEDYYNDIVIVQAPTDNASIYKILKGAGYSDEAINEIARATVDNENFKGNNVLATILRDIGYDADNWEVSPVGNSGLKEGDKCATVTNGPLDGTIQGGECVSTTPAGPDCKVITQENADECGYEISSDGQLVPKDLSKDPESYPTYVSCGGGVFAETINDCPDMEGTGSQIPEDQTKTAQAIKDWIEGQIGKVKDMTVDDVLEAVFGSGGYTCELTGEGEEPWDCAGTDGTEGNQCWKDCVSASVLGGIPGLPMPPGNIDVGTVRDLENKVEEIGGTISDIFSAPQGDEDDEGFIQRAKDWVLGKIDDIFGGIDDVTPGQITDWITGVLGTTISGIILQEIEGKKNDVIDKINEITGLPLDTPTNLINCSDYGREGGEVKSIEECGGCLNKTQEIGTDDRCRDKAVVDDFTVDCASEGRQGDRGTKQGDKVTGCGPCLSTHQEIDGQCVEWKDTGDTEDDCIALNREYIPSTAAGTKSSCGQCEEGFDPDANNPTGPCIPSLDNCQSRGLVKDDITGECVEPLDCTPNTPCTTKDGAPGKYADNCDCVADFVNPGPTPEECKALGRYHVVAVPEQNKPSECGDCINGSTNEDCSIDDNCETIDATNADECGYQECNGFYIPKEQECPTTVDPCSTIDATNADECGYKECNGSYIPKDQQCPTTVDPCLDSAYAEANPTICGTDPECNDCTCAEYAEANPTICGMDPECNDCTCAEYAKANPTICGTDPECNDCTCAEYAAANPEECGTAPPPEPPSGGSGGTGGAGGGMFSVDAGFELQGDPQLLTKMQFPIQNFLQQYVEGIDNQNTSITSLFEGLV